MLIRFYEKRIINLIQKSFKNGSHKLYKESSSKKIYGILVEDLLLLIDSVLEENGTSFKINLLFIKSEFIIDGLVFNDIQVMMKVLKALRYLKS